MVAARQTQILYRQFLFRIVDLELLSATAQGDADTLLGQFASLLVFISLIFGFTGLTLLGSPLPPVLRDAIAMTMEHALVATTMLAVGLFAVLSWDSTYPDRRDVLVLAPLPVRARTLFVAKIAASASALGLTVGVLNSLAGLAWPLVLHPDHSGVLRLLRSFAAYWITMFASGIFIYCSVLFVQGVTAQLFSRRNFLRLSGVLQIAAFCLFVSVYFLEPSFVPATPTSYRYLPSFWFLGLMQQLNGTLPVALAPLAQIGRASCRERV